jgi:hypothetical protein
MTYDFIVYTHSSRFPEPSRLAEEVSVRSPELALPPSFDLRVARGYVPLDNTGFEVTRSPITPAQVASHRDALREASEADDEHLVVLLESDTRIIFRCKDDDEISIAKLVAGAVAKLSNGFVCDPQRDVLVRGRYLPS